jgi:hypothetical protein
MVPPGAGVPHGVRDNSDLNVRIGGPLGGLARRAQAHSTRLSTTKGWYEPAYCRLVGLSTPRRVGGSSLVG